jgi:hypothetical protein
VPHPCGGATNREAGVRAALAVLKHRGIRREGQQRGLGTAAGLWGDAWKENPAGGGARGGSIDGERRWQKRSRGGSGGGRGRRSRQCQKDLFAN